MGLSQPAAPALMGAGAGVSFDHHIAKLLHFCNRPNNIFMDIVRISLH